MILYLQKIIKSQRKLYLIILFILTILSALEFVLLGIYSSFTDLSNLYFIILRLISAIAIFISFFLTLMINNYFIENKYEEFSIILLSGCRTKNIIEYIVLQFGMLFVLADIMGFAVGYILMFMINHIQSYYFNYSIVTIAFSYAGILLCKMIYVFMINFSKFIRIKLNIADYITRHTSLTSQKQYFSGRLLANQTHQFPLGALFSSGVAVLLLILSIQGLFDYQNGSLLPVYFMCFLLGEVMMINTTIPLVFDFLHDRYLMKAPKMIMILANIMHLSKVLVSLINILACVIPVCLSNFFFGIMNDEILAVTMICFYILLIMISLSFVLRFQVYLPSIETDIATLKAIGYHYSQLIFIYNGVVAGFMIIVVIFPLMLYSLLLYRTYLLSYISISIVLILIISYLTVFTLLAFYMLHAYHQTVKEAYYDVKYLNRSE